MNITAKLDNLKERYSFILTTDSIHYAVRVCQHISFSIIILYGRIIITKYCKPFTARSIYGMLVYWYLYEMAAHMKLKTNLFVKKNCSL